MNQFYARLFLVNTFLRTQAQLGNCGQEVRTTVGDITFTDHVQIFFDFAQHDIPHKPLSGLNVMIWNEYSKAHCPR